MMATEPMTVPAGPPSPFQEKIRTLAHKLPRTRPGRAIASVLLRLAGGKANKAFDVTIFGTQKARLHPFDNISEKRVFITPQFWDPEERTHLESYITRLGTQELIFLDVGANAGLYSLFARAACQKAGKSIRIIAIEPDPVMRTRMLKNLQMSNGADEATLLPWAATAERRNITLHLNTKSRGLNSIDDAHVSTATEAIEVEGHPIADIFNVCAPARLDIMKIDIEGAEHPALAAFFATAGEKQKPALILIEVSHEAADKSAFALCLENGYEVAFNNGKNAILRHKGDALNVS